MFNFWRSPMKKVLNLTVAILLSTLACASFAGDAAAGKAKSVTCAGCHGANGISNNPMWPNLAGQKQAYLASALQMYRDGRRKNAMMSAMAKNLTDADIANLAAYYTSLK
jgi:cytochrome c553